MASDLDRILERLVVDAAFVDLLRRDPSAALAGYEVQADDLEVLAASVGADPGGLGHVEDRQNKAALAGLASGVFDAISGPSGHHDSVVARPFDGRPPVAMTPSLDAGGGSSGSPDGGLAEHLMDLQEMMGGVDEQRGMLAADVLAESGGPDALAGSPGDDLTGVSRFLGEAAVDDELDDLFGDPP